MQYAVRHGATITMLCTEFANSKKRRHYRLTNVSPEVEVALTLGGWRRSDFRGDENAWLWEDGPCQWCEERKPRCQCWDKPLSEKNNGTHRTHE